VTLVLASGSAIRRTLLTNAGLPVIVDPADIDEAVIKTRMQAEGAPAVVAAVELAVAKAQAVSKRHPAALIVGADQLLTLGSEWFDKPPSREAVWTFPPARLRRRCRGGWRGSLAHCPVRGAAHAVAEPCLY
jgi:predicted house-cleaning NTP pyrophosphatase (Maf/HAM1 superfamily)